MCNGCRPWQMRAQGQDLVCCRWWHLRGHCGWRPLLKCHHPAKPPYTSMLQVHIFVFSSASTNHLHWPSSTSTRLRLKMPSSCEFRPVYPPAICGADLFVAHCSQQNTLYWLISKFNQWLIERLPLPAALPPCFSFDFGL